MDKLKVKDIIKQYKTNEIRLLNSERGTFYHDEYLNAYNCSKVALETLYMQLNKLKLLHEEGSKEHKKITKLQFKIENTISGDY